MLGASPCVRHTGDRLETELIWRWKAAVHAALSWTAQHPPGVTRDSKCLPAAPAGVQLNKVDDWYCKKLLPAFQSARREAQQLQAVLDLVQGEEAAPTSNAPAVAAEAARAAEPRTGAEAGAVTAAERTAQAAATGVQAAEAKAAAAIDAEEAVAETQAAAVEVPAAAVAVATEPEPASAATEQRTVRPSAVEHPVAKLPARRASKPADAAQEPALPVVARASPLSRLLAACTEEKPAEPAPGVAAAQAAGRLQGTTAAAPAVASAAVAAALASTPRPARSSISGCSQQLMARRGRRASAPAPLAAPLAVTPTRAADEQAEEEAPPAQVEEVAAPAAAAQLLQAEPASSQPAARRASLPPRPAATTATGSTQPASQQTASTQCTQGIARSARLPVRSLSNMLKDWRSKGGAPGSTPSKRQAPGSSTAKGGPGSRSEIQHAACRGGRDMT